MINYGKIKSTANGKESFRYKINNVLVKSDRVPAEVKEALERSDNYEYDEKPGITRCLFCDAPQSHQRLVTGLMIELCDIHYYTENVGRIVAKLNADEKERINNEAKALKEAKEKSHGVRKKKPKRRRQKSVQPQVVQPAPGGEDPAPAGAPGGGEGTEE